MNVQIGNFSIQKCGVRLYNSEILLSSLNVGKRTLTKQFQPFSITAYMIKSGLEKFWQFIHKKLVFIIPESQKNIRLYLTAQHIH